MSKVYAGTSGWSYSTWKPGFYPGKLPSAKLLNYYATRLNSAEVNYTFRSFLTDKLSKSWADATPAEFTFAIKANQGITHRKRLRGAEELTERFVNSLQYLKNNQKLGPVLFQLPPFLKCDVPLLKDFLAVWPRSLRATFEFRDVSWFTDEVFSTLHERNVALCQAESEKIETPSVLTADFFYLRLRKEKYSSAKLKEQIQTVKRLSQSGDVFVYFKHEEKPTGALRAEKMLAALAGS